MIRRILFYIPMIQNQVAKWQLTFIGKVTCNSDKQLLMKLLTSCCNIKWQVVGVLHSYKKILLQNIALIVPTVDRYGSLKLRAHLAIDKKYCKYLINRIGNAPTPPLVPLPSPTTERAQPPYTPSPPRPSQSPLTS